MTIEIIIPKVGEITTEVRIIRWLKVEGQVVKKGEPLLEVETDKATLEIESYAEGTLEHILVPEGEYADAMQVVATLSGEADVGDLRPRTERSPSPDRARDMQKETAHPDSAAVLASPVARRLAEDLGIDVTQIEGTGRDGKITAKDVRRFHEAAAIGTSIDDRPGTAAASPKAKRLAKELGVDLAFVKGTGVGGMITADDVHAAVSAEVVSSEAEDVRELSKLRRTIANRMVTSKQTVPHFYLKVDVSMGKVQQLRTHCVEDLGWECPPTYTDIIVRACALALGSMPEVNVQFSEDRLLKRKTVDIGVAVGLDDGLIAPTLSNADQKGLRETSEAILALTRRACDGRLKVSDLAKRSMAVSNLGMEGIDSFVAIIDPPDPMILAVGRVADRVIPFKGEMTIKPMCCLTLSIDHRVLDGVLGSRFLMRVKEHLENTVEIMGE